MPGRHRGGGGEVGGGGGICTLGCRLLGWLGSFWLLGRPAGLKASGREGRTPSRMGWGACDPRWGGPALSAAQVF